ncbi:hypothetical protein [Maledivibacter halophilus]|uniref:Uncharacterized protein n=1 Tax=Maledivibacter halophilus TaxID=36842 RepID=A0A1T5K1V3_9FIRM|nr:hypothetical protein [Maledivibacter halophilus]SKC57530.1 hypothetical protein SAMN02194393_01546 [Maledivibacter halophilus]
MDIRKNELGTMEQGVRVSPLPFGFDGYMGLTNQLYVSGGVLSGPHYANGKPSYMQSLEYSRKLNITGGRVGLIINFALGVTGGLFVNRSIAHYGTYVLEMPESPDKAYFIWAELNNDGATMSFGYSIKKKLTYSRFEPENPVTGDYWFDIPSNIMKLRRSREVEDVSGEIVLEYYWEEVKRVILGWIAQGTDGCIYSMTSFPLHYWFSEQYPEHIKYDGVSIQTDGRFIAENYEHWKDNVDICTNVANSSVARDAIYYGADLWSYPIGQSNEMLTGKMLVGWTEQEHDKGLNAFYYSGIEDVVNDEVVSFKILSTEFLMNKLLENYIARKALTSSLLTSNLILSNETLIEWYKQDAQKYSLLFINMWKDEMFTNFIGVRDSIFEQINIEPSASFYYETDRLRVYVNPSSTAYRSGQFVTDSKVDITKYSKLKIEWESLASGVYGYGHFGLIDSKTTGVHDSNFKLSVSNSFDRKIDELDISELTGTYHIGAGARAKDSTSNTYTSNVYIYKIWLEE